MEDWTEPKKVMRWWGPEGFNSPVARIDFGEGGTSLVCMLSSEDQESYNTWEYRKIIPMERIEFVQTFADKDGKKADPVAHGLPPDFPQVCVPL